MARLPYSPEGAAREPAAPRRGGRRPRGGELGVRGRALDGDRLHAGAGADAGLHGRAGDRRPRRDARRDGGARRRPGAHQPARPGRAGDRPLDPGGRVRRAARLPAQRRVRVRPQPRALRVPALGADSLRQLQRGAAQHRHLPPGQPRVPGARGRDARRPGLPRHARRHRLAHDDDQRPRGARLGRRRHRGRGRDARPAGLHADPAGRRLPAGGRAARGLDRDRPRPDRDPDAARARRRRQVRRVLRPRPREAAAGRPRDDREHVARVRRDLRHLPGRRGDAALPRVLRPPAGARGAGRGLLPRAGPLPRGGRRGGRLLRHARARPRRGGAVAGRPEAPAGSRGAHRCGRRLPLRAVRDDRRRRGLGPRLRRVGGRELPGQRPADRQRRRHGAQARPRPRGRRDRASAATARASTTAPS